MARRKLPGRFCWCCGCRRANEGFSRKHHVCRTCKKLGKVELAFRQQVRNIDRLLTWEGRLRRTQRCTFEKYLVHPDERVRAYAVKVKEHNEALRQEAREMWAEIRAEEDAYDEATLAEYDYEDEEFFLRDEEDVPDVVTAPVDDVDLPF